MYDHNKLLGAMKERNFTQEDIAKVINVSCVSFSSKLKGKSQFKASEIQKIMNCLDLPLTEVADYFFAR